ncbi:DEKNAAC103729 [Brettanomyces naardenensis]|uniref:DEKNAAC103729 n=1 Tax=Brettanomyces naardenensis TaxID=13370 RepID=A0A448YP65_BRENA|nr:DEKNAAC103729 [Brettanomyces naardenensis]
MSKFFDVSSRSSSVSSFIPPVLTHSHSSNSTFPAQQGGQGKSLTKADLKPLPDSWVMWYHNRSNFEHANEEGEEGEDGEDGEEEEEEEEEERGEQDADAAAIEPTDGDGKTASSSKTKQYLEGMNPISFPEVGSPLNETTETIDTVEQFWQLEANLKSFEDLPVGTEFFFFKNGVKPMWEDPANVKGGRWIFHFVTDRNDRNSSLRSALIWERLLLRLISGTFIPEDNLYRDLVSNDICGVTLSVRGDRNIISIWNTHLEYYKYFTSEVKKYKEEAERLRKKLSEEQGGDEDEGGEFSEGDDDEEGTNGGGASPYHLSATARAVRRLVDNDVLTEALTGDSYFGLEEEKDKFDTRTRRELRNVVKLTPFALRRGIANAMFRLIAEVDKILDYGENPITTRIGGNEQIKGVCSKSKYKRHFYATPNGKAPKSGFRYGNINHSNNNNYGRGENYHRHRHYNEDGSAVSANSGNGNGNEDNDSGATTGDVTNSNFNGSNSNSSGVYTFRRRKHFQREGENVETSTEQSRGFRGRRANNNSNSNNHRTNRDENGLGGWRRVGNTSTGKVNDKVENKESNNHNRNTTTKAPEESDNSFAALGKQRKKLEFNEDGKLVEEVNMLNFGSRRRRMLQMQREHK